MRLAKPLFEMPATGPLSKKTTGMIIDLELAIAEAVKQFENNSAYRVDYITVQHIDGRKIVVAAEVARKLK